MEEIRMAESWHKFYTLMHKSEPVAEIELDEATNSISAIRHVYAPQHVPVGVRVKDRNIDRAALNEWWRERAIPITRDGIKEALLELNMSITQELLDKSYGMSLTDQYWISPSESQLEWSAVNFFHNPFSEDVGNVLIGGQGSSNPMNLVSPDNTTDGWLKKKWTMIDGKRYLLKAGSGETRQEPYNEVIATKLMERLGIPHVPYTLIEQEGSPYSECENLITPQTELITAWYVMQTNKKRNHISVYQHYVNCCEALGIAGIVEALDQMIVVDYLIANEDRHQNNFGVVRNAETLEWIGPAPIYDSGSSLWFSNPLGLISANAKLTCKPFKSDHNEQIKLVTSFDWLDLSLLDGIEEEVQTIFNGSHFVNEARCLRVCQALRGRIERLQKFIDSREPHIWVDDYSTDVKENIAYSGSLEEDE